MLTIRNLTLNTGVAVDLALSPGQRVALSGPSGCGKTCLLRIIADLDPHHAEIRLHNIDQQTIPAPEWRRKVAYLPAESGWWDELLGAHFPQPEAALFEALGFSLNWLEKPVDRLSTGERQRFALLRLLHQQPEVLLLDEPTANLDNENTQRVETLLTQYRQQHAAMLLWVSHDVAQQQNSDIHYRFSDHQLIRQ